jgi:type II secretory pathway pseudopilin PulG
MLEFTAIPRRNRRGVTIIELTIAMIVLVFLALASFFTLANLSGDSKAEATVATLEKMLQWRDQVLARGDASAVTAWNALSGPSDATNIGTLRSVLGSNFRPQAMQMALSALCESTKVPGDMKNRVASTLGQTTADQSCTAPSGEGYAENAYPLVSLTGGTGSPFYAQL